MIKVEHLTRRYGSFVAVDDLSFHMEPGRIYGFLGPNGAGKSTTMNVLTGYLSAGEGSVTVNGYDVFEEPALAKRQIGYLPEQPPLYLDMTVREYLYFAAGLKKVKPFGEKELAALLEATGLSDVSGRLIRALSKGYRQRVGIAQALVGDPPVIILDEPTVGLDPLQRVEVRELIRSLGGSHTVVLSTHILSEVAEVADTVLIMSHGRLVAQDTPGSLARRAQGSRRSRLLVKGAAQTVRGALEALPVKSVQVTDAGEGLVHVELEYDGEQDLRETIFYALAAAGCPIFEAAAESHSLEDVFLELTAGEDIRTADGPDVPPDADDTADAVNEEE